MIEEITSVIVAEIAKFIDAAPADIDINRPLAGIIDSLQGLQLVVLLERKFGVQIEESDIQNFSTVSKMAELVDQRRPKVAVSDAGRMAGSR